MTDLDELRLELMDALGTDPGRITPLSGGAGRCQMWTLSAAGRPLVFRRHAEGHDRSVVREREWSALRLAHRAGVPVPEPIARTPTGLVMQRVPGEARPHRLLHDDLFGGTRRVLVAQVARAAVQLHTLPVPEDLPSGFPLAHGGVTSARTPAAQAVADLETVLDGVQEAHPVVELGLRWLRLNLPEPAPCSIVHGDLRLSNLIADKDGLRALVDWELVHCGDGAEDLGWMCIRSWRFGRDDLPALGCGTREQLLTEYAEAGGRRIGLEELRWWEVCGNARWAAICLLQPRMHLEGLPPPLERAMVGRRACEAEWDLLQLLADGRPPPPAARAGQDAPDASKLLGLVAAYLREELRPAVPTEHAFRLLVAANACSVVARELTADFAPVGLEHGDGLAAELRTGAHDDRLDELIDPLRATTLGRLGVAHPGWETV